MSNVQELRKIMHIDIHYHYLPDIVASGITGVVFITSAMNKVKGLTIMMAKLEFVKFWENVSKINGPSIDSCAVEKVSWLVCGVCATDEGHRHPILSRRHPKPQFYLTLCAVILMRQFHYYNVYSECNLYICYSVFKQHTIFRLIKAKSPAGPPPHWQVEIGGSKTEARKIR